MDVDHVPRGSSAWRITLEGERRSTNASLEGRSARGGLFHEQHTFTACACTLHITSFLCASSHDTAECPTSMNRQPLQTKLPRTGLSLRRPLPNPSHIFCLQIPPRLRLSGTSCKAGYPRSWA